MKAVVISTSHVTGYQVLKNWPVPTDGNSRGKQPLSPTDTLKIGTIHRVQVRNVYEVVKGCSLLRHTSLNLPMNPNTCK